MQLSDDINEVFMHVFIENSSVLSCHGIVLFHVCLGSHRHLFLSLIEIDLILLMKISYDDNLKVLCLFLFCLFVFNIKALGVTWPAISHLNNQAKIF